MNNEKTAMEIAEECMIGFPMNGGNNISTLERIMKQVSQAITSERQNVDHLTKELRDKLEKSHAEIDTLKEQLIGAYAGIIKLEKILRGDS